MTKAYADLVKLALKNGGKIPSTIPAHYVAYVYAIHKAAKGLSMVRTPYNRLTDGVICL